MSESNTDMEDSGDKNGSDGDADVLTALLGKRARVKVLAALLDEDTHDLNAAQIAESAGIHRTTVYEHLDQLEDLGVVVQTREISGSKMYRINRDNRFVQTLVQLKQDLLDERPGQYT